MRSLVGALLLVALVGAGCGSAGRPAQLTQVIRGDGVRYSLPAGWQIARGSLTPHLSNPRQLLTVGTGPLPAGGERTGLLAACPGGGNPPAGDSSNPWTQPDVLPGFGALCNPGDDQR